MTTAAAFIVAVEEATAKLTTQVAAELAKAYRLWSAGDATTGQLTTMLAGTLHIGTAQARVLGDQIAAHGLIWLGYDALPIGATLGAAEADRLTRAAETLVAGLDSEDGIAARLARIGQAEPAQALREAMRDTYAGNQMDGYTRGLNAGACELCRWLHKDGHVFPIDQPMHQHPGCGCVPIPTKRGNDA